jgi:hypothetical protein
LIFVLGLSIFDYSAQLTSQKHKRFKNLYETNLIDKAWKEINECYSSIRLYPPLPEIDNGYNFINLANNQRLSINIGRFARLDNNQLAISFEKMHNDFAMGSLEVESLYIFSSSKFVLPDVTNFHNNLAIFTSKNSTGWGILDGYAFIAPEIGTCDGAPNLKMNLTSLGVPQNMKYNLAEEIKFGLDQDSNKYILKGFSQLQKWGVWSVGYFSDIILHLNDSQSLTKINIKGFTPSVLGDSSRIAIELNDKYLGECEFDLNPGTCELDINKVQLLSDIVKIRIVPEEPRSPKDLGLSNEESKQGLGLISITLE